MDFIYEKARSLNEALVLKSRYAKRGVFIAGGTGLLVDVRNKVVKPESVIDISDLGEINYIRQEGGQTRIGAVTRISDIQKSSIVHENTPILVEACQKFANPLIKNIATLGGNLINASPSADMAPPLLTLGADIVLKRVNGERVVSLEEFLVGAKMTSQENDELLTEIRFENNAWGKRFKFLKLGKRNGTSISIVSLALGFYLDDGLIKDMKLALGSVAPVPLRAYQTEAALDGFEPSLENIKRAGNILKNEINPITDVRGSKEYRREMSAMLLLMAFQGLGYGIGGQ